MTKTAFTLILKISNFFLFELTLITIFYRFSTNPLPILNQSSSNYHFDFSSTTTFPSEIVFCQNYFSNFEPVFRLYNLWINLSY